MRIAALVMVSAMVASSALARLGETVEQVEKRYGSPCMLPSEGMRPVRTNEVDNTVHRTYRKGGIDISAIFFPRKSGASVVGSIEYLLTDDVTNRIEVIQKLLEANANGEVWEKVKTDQYPNHAYRMNGAIAEVRTLVVTYSQFRDNDLLVTSDEYKEYIKEAEAAHERKKAEALKKEQEGF